METVGRFFRDRPGSYFLFCPRGTGKSTWIAEHLPNALRVDLLAPENLRAYSARPERLRDAIEAHPKAEAVVIDEVQRVPALLDIVHQQVESGSPRRFVLTGSSSRKLKRAGVNLLAGRAADRSLHPFMASELGSHFDLDRALKLGTVPLVWNAADPLAARDAYLSLYIREEVQAEGIVRDLGAFARFLEAISLSHGGVLSLATAARECEVNRKTAEGYLQVLEDLLLAYRVPVFTRKAKRHLAVHPKFYWFDTGVFRSGRPTGPLDAPEEITGAALEGLVAQHLRAWIAYTSGRHGLYFWRTKSGSEVDFVVYGETGLWALEVKNAARLHPRDLRGLQAFQADYPEARVALLYRGPEAIKIRDVLCLPVDSFLRALRPDDGVLAAFDADLPDLS